MRAIRGVCGVVLVSTYALSLLHGADPRPLSLDERIAAQRAVEQVYWNHRIWPKENAAPKPPLSAVMSDETLRAKVEDTLSKSGALGALWRRPITTEQLQAELDRMSAQTRDPEMLSELYAALSNDPRLIAETLARAVIADRSIRTLYASDASRSKRPFDEWWAETRGSIDADVRAMEAFGPLSITMPTVTGCTADTWTTTLRTGLPDPRDLHTAVWTGAEMIVWGGHDGVAMGDGGRYDPATDSWQGIPAGASAPIARREHTAVWTGTQMVVWGGYDGATFMSTGGRFDPVSGLWSPTSVGANVPTGRYEHTAVWTGSEMIVWGGAGSGGALNTGGRYNPSTDTWTVTSTVGAPPAREIQTAVWTGSKMIVWGGAVGATGTNTGGRYDPSTDSWAATSPTNAPSMRYNHTAVWTGTEMIIWGGRSVTNTGARYNPVTDTWVATSTGANVPIGRERHVAVWTGSRMIVWGGTAASAITNTGGLYDPSSDSWTPTSTGANVSAGRQSFTAVWTGSEMIVWGGSTSSSTYTHGGARYNPSADAWTPTSLSGAGPGSRSSHVTVWTGAEAIVWGGSDGDALNTGGRFDPATNSWTPTSTGVATPAARYDTTAVWSGTEMIVWGGYNGTIFFGDGGRYNPATDSWMATGTPGAPAARRMPTSIWTGTEMIVWGGINNGTMQNSGGRYNPAADSWTSTSTGANVPAARIRATSVWSGTQMIVWGGSLSTGNTNTGGRYAPATDSWTPTSTGANVPALRQDHSAVWTGSEMIVWGGLDTSAGFYNSGGRYDPAADSWTPTSIGANVPVGRSQHRAVWTGAEMIVWGGAGQTGAVNSGGRYDRSTDTWVPIATQNAPAPRNSFTSAWTGSQMFVFGGNPNTASGGLYCGCPNGKTIYLDADGDGYGDAARPSASCDGSVPAGFSAAPGDCNDASAAVHPGATEICNGIDDDCDGTIDDALPPAGSPSLTEAPSGANTALAWTSIAAATGYDVLMGSLGTLRGTGGNFASATISCVANDLAATTTQDASAASASGTWYLVRPVSSCGGPGSYDDGAPGQSASRNAGIAASGTACP